MAKGDKKKVETQVKTQVGNAQNSLNDIKTGYLGPAAQDFKNNYDTAVPMQMQDYRDIMDAYKSYTGGLPANNRISAERVSYNRTPEMQKAMSGYSDFADTGGFSDSDLTSLRSRALSPVSTVYNNMKNEMIRQKNIQGGYSPNFNVAAARMRSGTSQQMSDILQQVNGEIAQMVQSGKLSGLSGLGGLATQDSDFALRAGLANQSAALEAARANQQYGMYDPRLQALQGMSSLYSAEPGMAKLFGDQMLEGNSQLLGSQGYQNQIGQMGINGSLSAAQVPGDFSQAINNIGQVGGMIGQVAAPFFNPTSGMLRSPMKTAGMARTSGIAGPISSTYNPMGRVSFPPGSMSLG